MCPDRSSASGAEWICRTLLFYDGHSAWQALFSVLSGSYLGFCSNDKGSAVTDPTWQVRKWGTERKSRFPRTTLLGSGWEDSKSALHVWMWSVTKYTCVDAGWSLPACRWGLIGQVWICTEFSSDRTESSAPCSLGFWSLNQTPTACANATSLALIHSRFSKLQGYLLLQAGLVLLVEPSSSFSHFLFPSPVAHGHQG